jgi:hypothetical protein
MVMAFPVVSRSERGKQDRGTRIYLSKKLHILGLRAIHWGFVLKEQQGRFII